MAPQETDPDLPMSVQESGRGVGRWWPAAGLGALGVAVGEWDLLKEIVILFIISTTVSVQFSRSVVSDFLRPPGLQHTRPPYLSPAPGVYSNLGPLSQ